MKDIKKIFVLEGTKNVHTKLCLEFDDEPTILEVENFMLLNNLNVVKMETYWIKEGLHFYPNKL